jgi:hypothetical protein
MYRHQESQYSNEFESSFEQEDTFLNQETDSETEELELATELLGVSNDAELNQFLGSLISKAAGVAKGFARSAAGQQIGGLLKDAARKALPGIGEAIGERLGGEKWKKFGGEAAQKLGKVFGLELEGLSNEDSEFEVARQYVRFARDAIGQVARPNVTARDARVAYMAAARNFAPGLLLGTRSTTTSLHPSDTTSLKGFPNSGRWIRRGQSIILS